MITLRATVVAVLAGAAALLAAPVGEASEEEPRGRVVLLHGLGRTSRAMAPMAEYLFRAGFEVHNLDYPSRSDPPDELVIDVRRSLEECCGESSLPLHFVTHSLGAIVARAVLEESPPEPLGRMVMLAPPNHGSEIVDWLGPNSTVFRKLFGPSWQSLGTDASSWPARLPLPTFDFGVIAGRRSWNPVGSWMIPGEDDGTVSVESARLPGMRDFLVVDATHTWIMTKDEVAAQVVHFLDHGRFQHVEH